MRLRGRVGDRRGVPRWRERASGAGWALAWVAWATLFGCGPCYEDPWTVGIDQTVSVETVGTPPVAHLQVDLEVTPLLSEVGEPHILLWRMPTWVDAGAGSSEPVLTVRFGDPSVASDGGVAYPYEARPYWDYGYGTDTFEVPVDCDDGPCASSVALEIETTEPAAFALETRVEVVGPTDGEPAAGEVHATWTVLP